MFKHIFVLPLLLLTKLHNNIELYLNKGLYSARLCWGNSRTAGPSRTCTRSESSHLAPRAEPSTSPVHSAVGPPQTNKGKPEKNMELWPIRACDASSEVPSICYFYLKTLGVRRSGNPSCHGEFHGLTIQRFKPYF